MNTLSKIVALTAAAMTVAVAAPNLAAACGGGYGDSAQFRKDNAERARIAKVRKTRSAECVIGSLHRLDSKMISALPNRKDTDWRTAFMSYPRESASDYGIRLYGAGYTFNRFGYSYGQLYKNTKDKSDFVNIALRPDGKGEWIMVQNFKAECPVPSNPKLVAGLL